MRSIHSMSIGLLLGVVIPRLISAVTEGGWQVWLVLLILLVLNIVSWFAYLSERANTAFTRQGRA